MQIHIANCCHRNCVFQTGDEIVEVNGRPCSRVTHDEAVRSLKFSRSLSMVVRDVGKVPVASSSLKSTNGNNSSNGGGNNNNSASRTSSGSNASTVPSAWTPNKKFDEEDFRGRHFNGYE